MDSPTISRPYPKTIRFPLGFLAFLLIIAVFIVMRSLSYPSQFVSAYMSIEKGPGKTSDLKNISPLDFNQHLYLIGPVISAAGQTGTALFQTDNLPVLQPSIFTDNAGAVEVLSHEMPLTAEPVSAYHYNDSLHILGWRTSSSGYTLFAVSKSREGLLELLLKKAGNWKYTIFSRGLVLALIVFSVFWLLNISLLSNVILRPVQLLIVNLIFLVLYYSVLVLSAYPLTTTLPQTLFILLLANLAFIPLSLAIRSRH